MTNGPQELPIEHEVLMLNTAREALARAYEYRRNAESDFSMRRWARQMGYANPSMLSSVLGGKRRIKPDMARLMAKSLGLQDATIKYVELLAHMEVAKTPDERRQWLDQLEEIAPQSKNGQVGDDAFFLMRDWYYSALLVLAETDGIEPDFAGIAQLFGGRVKPAAIEEAINRLLRLGLVKFKGGRIRRRHDTVSIEPTEKNIAVRQHHRQMIELALEALDHQDRSKRNIQGSTHGLSASSYKSAVEIINRCHEDLEALAKGHPGSHVMQLNTQFFSLTTTEKRE